MIDRTQRRLGLALAASALLHLWLAHTADSPGARRVSVAGGAPLRATLAAPEIDGSAPNIEPRTTPPSQPATADVAHAPRAVAAAAAPSAAARALEPRAAVTTDGNAAVTQPSDPTYYAARSLDVFPKAITALALGAETGAANVRATVLIDEFGHVNDVRAIEAGSADIENAARELLLRTRFTPASKDGRMVKAQVLVSLE